MLEETRPSPPRRRRWLLALFLGAAAGAAAQPVPPAVVVLALDTSGSVPPEVLERTRTLALDVLGSLPAGSQVALLTFDDESRLVLERTADRERVRRSLQSVGSAGRFTALHDALYDASRYLVRAPAARRAIVLLTDGRDENSALLLEDGLRVARENAIPVFAVGVGRVEERTLRRIAKLTLGEYVTLAEASGPAIAGRIFTAPAPEAAPPREAAPEPAATPPPGEPAAERPLWAVWLSAALLAAVIGATAAALLRARRAERERLAAPDARTRVGGGPGLDDVPKTVLLDAKASLQVVGGPGRGREYRLSSDGPTSLGRAMLNEIVLEDESISAQHCRIRLERGQWTLHDLGSTNGTFVNERRVDQQRLRSGDVVRVGETSLQFRER